MSAMTRSPANNQVIAFSPELWPTVLLRRDMVSPRSPLRTDPSLLPT